MVSRYPYFANSGVEDISLTLSCFVGYAHTACEKILPYIVGGIVFFILVFGLYVRSVPPKERSPRVMNATAGAASSTTMGTPEFMHINTDPAPPKKTEDAERAALDEAMRLLKEREASGGTTPPGEPKSDPDVVDL